MALNIETFKTRALTALVFVVIMLGGLLYNQWSFLALFTLVHFGCWVEYQKLVGLIDKEYQQVNSFHQYGVMLAGFGFVLFMLNDTYSIGNFKLHELGWWMIVLAAIALPIVEVLFSKKPNAKLIVHSFLGLVYISLSWGLMMNLRDMPTGLIVPLVLIASIWINDTMAYIVGSFIGKTPLSKISPKKTWEGTIGGAVLAIVVVGIVMSNIDTSTINSSVKLPNYHWYVIAAIGAIVGTLGDLLESKLKRLANVKDSGSFMPGHGGFLDRFDSLILATPFVWLYLRLVL
ncbi:MAG: phosphatidate cytidylyltransferase [Chitinophagaceae bacterium]|jgi:phosphatidate cytidylyltransferase|nr:phosphatidate cytidylyltransferase [Chitinophagaceae bacterium]MBP9739712.1 phosphatidate cytidylyltransferase [Chitinophagaceae bacterium]